MNETALKQQIAALISNNIWVQKTKDGKSHFVDGVEEATIAIMKLLKDEQLELKLDEPA